MNKELQNTKVLSVNISEKKGTIKQAVDYIELYEKGIKKDAHSGKWHRQVSLLAKESIDKSSKAIGREIKFGEFAENFLPRLSAMFTDNILYFSFIDFNFQHSQL